MTETEPLLGTDVTSVCRRAPLTAVRPRPVAARTLPEVLAVTTARAAGRVAIDAADGVLTYAELAAATDDVAHRLRSLGIGPGDRVGVRVPSGTAELYTAILGVLSVGAAYVPVDADDPDARAEMIWRESAACAVVSEGLTLAQHRPGSGTARALRADDDAWVIFTSGSTGEPKGVAVSHRSAVALIDAEARLWSVASDDRVLAGLSVSFDASCEEMWLAWRNGAALVAAPRGLVRSGVEFGPWLVQRKISVISTVPTLAAMWDQASLAGVRLLILGGEACPQRLGWSLAAGRETWNTYGPTEATVVSTATRILPGEPITLGLPLDGWRVAVIDADDAAVAPGEVGELVIAGVGLGRYLDLVLDARRFAALPALGWERAYRSGDLVRETDRGLEFVGRRDGQVKLGGRRVELGEIEAALSAVPGVRAAAAATRTVGAGNTVLVGYVVGDVDPVTVRSHVAERLPAALVPLIGLVDSLPASRSGKVDRAALPWPLPPDALPRTPAAPLTATMTWLAERWADQLGPLPISAESDFFELGGSSVAAAKLVSVLRRRFPSAAVADVYKYRRLGELAQRLEGMAGRPPAPPSAPEPVSAARRWGALQVAGVAMLVALTAPTWLLGILAFNDLVGGGVGPTVGWGWLLAGWLLFVSAPGRALTIVAVRRALLRGLKPGRYPRRGWLGWRVWFVDRFTEALHLDGVAGTPWAVPIARLTGASVGEGARLGTLPALTSLISIGAGATLESDVDLRGWWIEGPDLVVGKVRIGAQARVGTRAMLMPGANIGAGAEIEPGSVISGEVPAGERWAGAPAACCGQAGELWPDEPAPAPRHRRFWKAMFALGIFATGAVPVIAALPSLLIVVALGVTSVVRSPGPGGLLLAAALLAVAFDLSYALLSAALVRLVCCRVRIGWHTEFGATSWALWFAEAVMGATKGPLFPLYSSVYTAPWLRVAGVKVGRRVEVSTAAGLNKLVSFADRSFAADDVVMASSRARAGWLHVGTIEIGQGTFLGNGALLAGETRLGASNLVGVLTSAPAQTADATTWFGSPPLEFPRIPARVDPALTTDPSRARFLARAGMELIRIMLPTTASALLGMASLSVLELIGRRGGLLAMVLAAPATIIAGGVCAAALTVAGKWLIIGRYRRGEHPLWSMFVWRDEIINSLQETLAGAWLLGFAVGTPLMSLYLRAMGTTVGADVWCETLTITEFDLVRLDDGCAINRLSCVESHLFHDRLMQIGSIWMGAGSTLGPASATLPDTTIGARASVGGRSVVLRGEQLPAGTRWHGAPVVSG